MFTKTICPSYHKCVTLTQLNENCDKANFEQNQRMILPHKNKNWQRLITFLILNLIMWNECLRPIMAAPQSCVLCDKDDIAAKDPQNSYEEFLFEHQVTRQDAINALKNLNQTFYDGPSQESSCKSIICTKTVMKYCLGPQFINDHCWCELGHNNEGLPFVPHICYVGEKSHKASVGSCFFYEEVKDCCCASALAKQWRHISVSSHFSSNILTSIMMLMLLWLVIY